MAETMNRATRIRILLLERGITQADIARDLGCSRAFVGQIVNGDKNTPRLRREIAKRIGLPYEDLWGAEESRAATG